MTILFATAWGWFPRSHLVGSCVGFVSGFVCKGSVFFLKTEVTTERKWLERS